MIVGCRVVERHRPVGQAIDELVHDRRRVVAQVGGRAARDHLAFRKNEARVGDLRDFPHVVRHHDAGDAEGVVERANEPQHHAHRDGIEARKRLVVNEDVGVHDDGARERDPSRHAARELLGIQRSGSTQPDGVQLRQHDGADQALGQPRVLTEGKRDVLVNVQVGEQCTILEQHAHAPAQRIDLLALELGEIEAIDDHLAAVRAHLAGDEFQQGRLARAARPHDGRHGTAADLDVESTEYGLARVHFEMDVAQDGNRRRLDRRSGSRGRSGLVIHEFVVWSLNGNGPRRSVRVP